MIFSQLTEQQAEEFAEQSKAETLKKFSERPATVSNQYLHDLYRFFKLNTRRNEFRDIFKEKIELHKISILKDILYQEGTLATIADYHLKKEHWAETTELYKEIERMNGPLSTQAEFYQKLGYAFQKQKDWMKLLRLIKRQTPSNRIIYGPIATWPFATASHATSAKH